MAQKSLTTYSTLCTEFYDLEHHVNHERALSFYMHHAEQAQGPIVEPMCGSGRFLIPMLQAGLDAEGFDASPAMIESFKQKYAKVFDGPAPVWQQFVQEFESSTRYQLIFIPYGSWGLITDLAEAKKGLEALYRALAPEGKLLVEVETVASVPDQCGVWRRGTHTRADGSVVALNFIANYQPQTQLFQSNSRYELIVNNNVVAYEDELFEQYLYRVDEFDELLRAVGCTNIKKYPAFDPARTVQNDTQTIIYECIKGGSEIAF